jgi:hypothetical protein
MARDYTLAGSSSRLDGLDSLQMSQDLLRQDGRTADEHGWRLYRPCTLPLLIPLP